jgi:hypothetical protein
MRPTSRAHMPALFDDLARHLPPVVTPATTVLDTNPGDGVVLEKSPA